MSDRTGVLPTEGPEAPPRRNGELVFEAPWESRAFGMAVALCEQGLFEWEEFRRCLIAEIYGAIIVTHELEKIAQSLFQLRAGLFPADLHRALIEVDRAIVGER